MRWQGGRRGGNIDDRRGMGGGAMIGGGLGTVVLAAIGYFVFGIDPTTTQQVASQFGGAGAGEQQANVGNPEDQAGQAIAVTRTPHADRIDVVGSLGGQRMTLTVSAGPCSDGMSDTVYPFAVRRRLGDDEQRGCAKPG